MNLADADSAEHGTGSKNIVITPVACALPNRAAGAPKLSGLDGLRFVPGSRLHGIYGCEEAREEYFCNYEVNPAYEERYRATGLRVAARGMQGEVRAVELPGNRFFLATLFQPQLASTAEQPHPVVRAYLEAAAAFAAASASNSAGKEEK